MIAKIAVLLCLAYTAQAGYLGGGSLGYSGLGYSGVRVAPAVIPAVYSAPAISYAAPAISTSYIQSAPVIRSYAAPAVSYGGVVGGYSHARVW